MPKAKWSMQSTSEGDGFHQSLLDHYFPKKNWLPPITVQVAPLPMSEGKHTGGLMHVIVLASCSWCGCCVEQGQWRNHINFHTNAV